MKFNTRTVYHSIRFLIYSDIEGASENDKKNFLGEAHLLLQFTHPNVLSMLGVVTIDDPVMIIFPFMKNGDLRSFLIK